MKTAIAVKNWDIGITSKVLENIHQEDINITIYNRDINILENEINNLIVNDINFNLNGNIDSILNELKKLGLSNYPKLLKDINNLLVLFKSASGSKKFQLLLATINKDMCKKFHMDNNHLRMLCTYMGPGTLWLKEDNINREALNAYKTNKHIVINENNIEQTNTGAVTILKGATYSKEETNAIVHRSPSIEKNGEKRLLLRIDMN